MRNVITAAFLLFTTINCPAQIDSILSHAKDKDGFEMVFVHTNKNNYIAGETIWMKAYLYDGLNPSAKSSSLKIQLISNDSNMVAQGVYPVVNGIAVATIKLPTSINTGRYFLKAIGNAGTSTVTNQYFIAPVFIASTLAAQLTDTVGYNRVATINFACAGGLLANQPNQVYISVTDQHKQPMQASGYLVDAENDTITTFSTNQLGVAEVAVIPSAIEKYTVGLLGSSEATYTIPPLLIKQNGVAMTVYGKGGDYNVLLNTNPGAGQNDYTLVAEYNYNVVAQSKVHFAASAVVVKLPFSHLPSGIIRLVLLNNDGGEVCTRFVFSPGMSRLMGVQGASFNLPGVDTVAGNIVFSNEDTLQNTFSASIADSSYYFDNIYHDENIVSRFLLTGWFKNYNPALAGLFDSPEKADLTAINGLLATQELLKPSWQQIKQLAADTTHPPTYTHINISGTVTPDGYKKLPKNASLSLVLSAADSSRNFSIIQLDPGGGFEMNDMVYSDSLTLYYQLISKIPSPVKLGAKASDPLKDFGNACGSFDFMQSFGPVKNVNIQEAQPAEVAMQKKIQAVAGSVTMKGDLPNVTVHANYSRHQKLKELSARYASSVFANFASQEFDLVDEPYSVGAFSVVDYLRIFGRRMKIPTKGVNGGITQVGGNRGYTLYLDEGLVTIDVLEGVDLQDVAYIKVFDNGFVLNAGPAIAIYTRKGADRVPTGYVHMQKVKIAGYSAVANFQNPDSLNLQKINRQALLSTFYWNPWLTLSNPQTSMPFYNINLAKKALVVVQGMAADGTLFYYKQTFTAK